MQSDTIVNRQAMTVYLVCYNKLNNSLVRKNVNVKDDGTEKVFRYAVTEVKSANQCPDEQVGANLIIHFYLKRQGIF